MRTQTTEEHSKIISTLRDLPRGINLAVSANKVAKVIEGGAGYNDAVSASGLTDELFSNLMNYGSVSGAPSGFTHFYSVVIDAIASRLGSTALSTTRTGYVYFIQDTALGFVKIGKAKDYKNRFESLQTSCPQDLIILAVIEDAKYSDVEKEIHSKYSKFRYRGEWFSITEDVLDEIISCYNGKYIAGAKWHGQRS